MKSSSSNNGVSRVTVISHTKNNIFCLVKRDFMIMMAENKEACALFHSQT